MQLLDLEPCCIRIRIFFLRQFVRKKQGLYGLLEVLRLKVALALVEVKFVRRGFAVGLFDQLLHFTRLQKVVRTAGT